MTQVSAPPKILVLTAREEEVDKGFAKKIGADDYLTKPFIFEELLKKVNNLLRLPPFTF